MKQAIFGGFLVIAMAVFSWTMRRYTLVALLGGKDLRPRFDQIPKRIWMVLVYFIGQRKVAERQLPPSPQSTHHLFIFWGFLVITVGTVEILVSGVWPSFRLSLLLGEQVAGGLWWVIDLLN